MYHPYTIPWQPIGLRPGNQTGVVRRYRNDRVKKWQTQGHRKPWVSGLCKLWGSHTNHTVTWNLSLFTVYGIQGEESVPVGKLETSRRRKLCFQVLAYTANNCAGIKGRLCQFWAWSTWGRLCSFPWSESFLLDIAVLKLIFTEDFIGSLHFHSRLPPFTTFPKLLCVTGWISSLWNC